MTKAPYRAAITAVAHWVPDKILTNADLEKMVDTSDEWIYTRTGIRERHILDDPKKATSYLATEAGKKLLEKTGIGKDEIDAIVFSTVTPDMFFPSTACLLQRNLGLTNVWGFDLIAACCGFTYALCVAAQFIESGRAKKVLAVGADKMTTITDYTDRNTCILFGDAGGVALVERSPDPELGIIDFYNTIDGTGADYLYLLGGGSLNPPTHETVDKKMHYLYQDGKTVYQYAVKGMADAAVTVLERNGLSGKDVDLLVPHQANKRIIDSIKNRLNLSDEQVMINIDRYGNTTTATIPICLSEAVDTQRLKKGDLIVVAAFGGGFTTSGILMRWAY